MMKFTNKLWSVSLFLIFVSSFLSAQTKEFGAQIRSLENMGFIYKKERKENRYIRHSLGFAEFQLSDLSSSPFFGVRLGYSFGFEKRRAIDDKFMFYHGIQPSVGLGYYRINSVFNYQQNNLGAGIGLGYILGFMYHFNDRFYVSLETVPGFNINFRSIDFNYNDLFVTGGFSTNTVAATVAYRIHGFKD